MIQSISGIVAPSVARIRHKLNFSRDSGRDQMNESNQCAPNNFRSFVCLLSKHFLKLAEFADDFVVCADAGAGCCQQTGAPAA